VNIDLQMFLTEAGQRGKRTRFSANPTKSVDEQHGGACQDRRSGTLWVAALPQTTSRSFPRLFDDGAWVRSQCTIRP